MFTRLLDSGTTLRGVELAAPIFAALGDETRLQLMARLCSDGPMSIARLAAGAPVTRQAVTKHLQVLADAGLARSSRVGRESVWELEPEPLDAARRCLDGISTQWDTALDRLKRFVERSDSSRARSRVMPTVRFTQNIQRHVGCPTREVAGETVRDVLDNYFRLHEQARGYVLDDQNRLRQHMAIFIDGSQIRDREGLSDRVPPDAVIDLVQALSGG